MKEFLRDWMTATFGLLWVLASISAICIGIVLAIAASPWWALLALAGILAHAAFVAI